MSQIHKHPVPAAIAANALINADQYAALYQQSVDDPETFWGEQGKSSIGLSPTAK
jgi:acetyl-CoA synthetase